MTHCFLRFFLHLQIYTKSRNILEKQYLTNLEKERIKDLITLDTKSNSPGSQVNFGISGVIKLLNKYVTSSDDRS